MSLRIAVIDSGINPLHPHVNGVSGGVSLRLDEKGAVLKDPDFSDHIGHGTAIAGIIREKAPGAEMVAVKIFHEKLKAAGSLLLAALTWAIDQEMNIIHLSLGTEQENCKSRLRRLCRQAFNRHIILIAAARCPDDGIFPAALPEVIGAYWNRQCRHGEITSHPGCNIEFGVSGRPRALPGIPENMNFSGHSFAAAQITARVASLLELHPNSDMKRLKDRLFREAGACFGS